MSVHVFVWVYTHIYGYICMYIHLVSTSVILHLISLKWDIMLNIELMDSESVADRPVSSIVLPSYPNRYTFLAFYLSAGDLEFGPYACVI